MSRVVLFTVLGLAFAACTTEPLELESLHLEGRVYDVESLHGLEGVTVALRHSAGAFGSGTSATTESDPNGDYVLAVEWDSPRLCEPGTYDLAVVIPDGYRPDLDEFEPLECVETVQRRDLKMRFVGASQ